MDSSEQNPTTVPLRREPPHFRGVAVRRIASLSPRMVRVTLGGPDLAGFTVEQPAASVRLLLPSPGGEGAGGDGLVVPSWNGNEFLLPDGRRPTIRTFTPRHVDPEALEIDLDIVIHGGAVGAGVSAGVASAWAQAAEPGDLAAVSGPGRGYAFDHDLPTLFLAGDETAIPAISQLLETLPAGTLAQVQIEVAHPDARLDLPGPSGATVTWWDLPRGASPGDALHEAVRQAGLVPGVAVWVAGEAAAMQRIRRHLFEDRGLSRSQATVRGYWKHGRSGEADSAT